MTALLIKLVGSKIAQKLVVSAMKVIVKRTDNSWDDELLQIMLEK